MGPEVFRAFAEAATAATEGLLTEMGAVCPPTMLVFRGEQTVGTVTLRPAHRGDDGALAVAEMATLAAAARATDVMVSWERLDLAVLCGAPPGSEPLALQACWATPDRQTLASFPFELQVQKRRRHVTARPLWDVPTWDDAQTPVPPVIAELLEWCWRPLEDPAADEVVASAYLRSLGYEVALAQ